MTRSQADAFYMTIAETKHVLVNAKKNFPQASDHCRYQLKGNLMTILNSTEQALAVSISEGTEVWIGLYTIWYNDWKWTSGASLSYRDWASNEWKKGLSCGTLKGGQWHSQSCLNKYYFLCSTDATTPAADTQTSNSGIASSLSEVNDTSSYLGNDSLSTTGSTNDSLSSLFENLNGISIGNPYGLGPNSLNTAGQHNGTL
ncbi:hypothetical protein NDU88_000474 [Pleurodeles waltl]|uniref:C-type lectin domain-containing protein n=1 Tax=Pleurodeles waltl TaxID=8319 RepID=A0AAV7KXY6_PLEWA|nr:hypothetical protein NDU88_000474 [Pleurodeles waltl]